MRTLLGVAALVVVGCGGSVVAVDDVDGLETAAQADAELTRSLRAEGGGLTVWVKPVLTARVTGQQTKWVLEGSASRELEGVFSFVPDDAFGEAQVTGPRSFEVALAEGYELNSILSGLRLLVNLTPRGATAPVAAGLELAPRFTSIRGSTRTSLSAEVRPVYARGGLVYRGQFRAAPGSQVSASTLDDATIDMAPTPTAGTFTVDFTYDNLELAIDVPGLNAEQVEFIATEPTGRVRSKLAVLAVTAKSVQLTTRDPYEAWPTTCPTAVRTCLNATPVGTTDFGACGSYREVSTCGLPHQVPSLFASPDDLTALTRALDALRVPAGKTVTFSAYGIGTRNVTPELAARAWLEATSSRATVTGTLTPGQVNSLPDGWNARALVPAAQQVVYQTSFRAVRLDESGATHVVLFFSGAARLVVFTLR